ncbi:cytochrome P450 [Streptomyces sp. NPDC090021]|uniref:cytochrome P450 family protein n=1 Tax=Streptomyces sp. NPDC090021 TaxID=3365919 RepID=UPI0038005287
MNHVEPVDTPEFLADPHRAYARMRSASPVQPVCNPSGLTYWMITGHQAARSALVDPRLSKEPRRVADVLQAAGYATEGAGSYFLPMVNSDPPEHTRLRRLVSHAFTARRIESLRPRVQQLTDELLDRLAEGSTPGRPVDLIRGFAFPLPVLVIAELLGLPPANSGRLLAWAEKMLRPTDGPRTPAVRSRRLRAWFAALIEAKRRGVSSEVPVDEQPDLLSALITAQDRGAVLTEQELVDLAVLLLVAGHETTTGLLGNGVHTLLRHPDQLALLRRRPELMATAVEELLRYEGPLARATLRVAAADLTIGEVWIPAGSVVNVSLAAAGRDPEVFPEPDRFDLTRPPGPHLAFGHGIHYCLGAPLARLQAGVALASLLGRFPDLALAEPDGDLPWLPISDMRALLSLPVLLRNRPEHRPE